MAKNDAASGLAKGIAKSATPAGLFEKLGQSLDPMQILQMLQGLSGQRAPALDEPLPRFGGLDERGQPIIIPPANNRRPGQK